MGTDWTLPEDVLNFYQITELYTAQMANLSPLLAILLLLATFTSATVFEDWGPDDPAEEDPACDDGYVRDGDQCVMDPSDCPADYEEYDGQCVSEVAYDGGSSIFNPRTCPCRGSYVYSQRRRRCIRCRRRRVGRRSHCGC